MALMFFFFFGGGVYIDTSTINIWVDLGARRATFPRWWGCLGSPGFKGVQGLRVQGLVHCSPCSKKGFKGSGSQDYRAESSFSG